MFFNKNFSQIKKLISKRNAGVGENISDAYEGVYGCGITLQCTTGTLVVEYLDGSGDTFEVTAPNAIEITHDSKQNENPAIAAGEKKHEIQVSGGEYQVIIYRGV